jgi:hypothetical protein
LKETQPQLHWAAAQANLNHSPPTEHQIADRGACADGGAVAPRIQTAEVGG